MFVESRFIRRCTLYNQGHWRIDKTESQDFGGTSDQDKSLTRIFVKGIDAGTATFKFKGADVQVFMVAGNGFPFADYSPILEGLARCRWRTHVPALFDEVVYRQLKLKTDRQVSTTARMIDGWFDSENDVFWVMSLEKQIQLLAFLRAKKETWRRIGLI